MLGALGAALFGLESREVRVDEPVVLHDAPSATSVVAVETERMADIPAGDFKMGSSDFENEKPVHPVTLKAFRMDVTEVTTEAYAGCVSAGKCTPADTGEYCNARQEERRKHPINCVDWSQATAYCEWAGKRLPTEEEWEYGARGTEGRKYSWGNQDAAGQLCWNGTGNDLGKGNRRNTCVVGSYPAGAFGLMDMAGNVWEWTSSGYSSDYGKPRDDAVRVNRGGGWYSDDPVSVRGAERGRSAPTGRYDSVGFRCAR